MAVATAELVERIWARDASVWTGADEDRWLGWLDLPGRMRARALDLEAFARDAREQGLTHAVLAGMGGSSLAPEVFRRTFGAEDRLHVLDTTHPDAIRTLDRWIDPDRTLAVVSSKSGTTLETQSHYAWLWERLGERADRFVAVTDPECELDDVARERRFRAVWHGDPEVGGRYSALSSFGLVPAALAGVDLGRLLDRTHEMEEACQLPEGNPGLDLGRSLGEAWLEGRDKVLLGDVPWRFGMWVEQLLAESTGKEGKGLIPVPDEWDDGPDRQLQEVRLADPYEVGQEFYRWEFATAVAGSIMGINPFDQPNVQEAKDRTRAILDSGSEPDLEPVSSLEELLAQAEPGDYFCAQAFVEPSEEAERRLQALRANVRRETGVVTTAGFGPRYLHSTGQLHKGGPPTGLFLQLVDDPEDVPIPGREYGFRRLIRAQAAGDFDALRERGRRVARMRWDDLEVDA
jgi:glucose-6-phosphate isomerase